MLEKIKSLLCSGAMISMKPSDSEPACISKCNRFRNKQSDSPFSLLSINVVCGHVPHWKHLLNWHWEEWRQVYCTTPSPPHKKIDDWDYLKIQYFKPLFSTPRRASVCLMKQHHLHCRDTVQNTSQTHNRRLVGRLSESFAPGSVWKTNAPVWAWHRHSHAERTHNTGTQPEGGHLAVCRQSRTENRILSIVGHRVRLVVA